MLLFFMQSRVSPSWQHTSGMRCQATTGLREETASESITVMVTARVVLYYKSNNYYNI